MYGVPGTPAWMGPGTPVYRTRPPLLEHPSTGSDLLYKAASYLGLVPSVKQSAGKCYNGPITKAGSSQVRWLLIQAAQSVGRHPGPLGAFFRKLEKRKNRNVAVVATARKMVTIAWHMLTNKEPYRYASPRCTDEKLAGLRVRPRGRSGRRVPPKDRNLPRSSGPGRPGRPPRWTRFTTARACQTGGRSPRVNGGWSIRAERSNTLPRWKSGKSCPGSKGSAAECEGRERRARLSSGSTRGFPLPPSPSPRPVRVRARRWRRREGEEEFVPDYVSNSKTLFRVRANLSLSRRAPGQSAASPGLQAEPFAWGNPQGLASQKIANLGLPRTEVVVSQRDRRQVRRADVGLARLLVIGVICVLIRAVVVAD